MIWSRKCWRWVVVVANHKWKWSKPTNLFPWGGGEGGGGGKLPNVYDPNLPTTDQMQMVKTYQLPSHFGGRVVVVNY